MRALRSTLLMGLVACAPKPAIAPVRPATPAPNAATAASPASTERPPLTERCITGPTGRLELLVGEATLVTSIDLVQLRASQLYRDLRDRIENGDFKRFIEAAAACGVAIDTWQRAVVAADPDNSQIAAVLTADGIGERSKLACIAEAVARTDAVQPATPPWTFAAQNGVEVLALRDGSTGWMVDGCTLVIATPKWRSATEALLSGRGRSIRGGGLEAALGRTMTGGDGWLAMTLPPKVGFPMLEGGRDVAVGIDLATGLHLSGSVGFADAAVAMERAELARTEIRAFGSTVSLLLPKEAAERVQIGTRGTAMTFDMALTPEELVRVRSGFGLL